MSRKQCKRRHYPMMNPISMAMEGAAITPDAALNKLQLRELASLDALANGKGGIQEWRDLADLSNLCETMANSGIGPEALPDVEKLEAALIKAARGYEATKVMALSAQGISAARHIIEWHSLQRRSVARSVYEQQIQKTVNRIRSGAPEVIAL